MKYDDNHRSKTSKDAVEYALAQFDGLKKESQFAGQDGYISTHWMQKSELRYLMGKRDS